MASQPQVKHYLALWFQLGHQAINTRTSSHSTPSALCPQPIFQGHDYSPEFDQAWDQILSQAADFYLEGGSVAIAELLSNTWEIIPCGNCLMPVPASILGTEAQPCPCHALSIWPNSDLPMPRLPVNDRAYLQRLCQRLHQQTPVHEHVS